MQVKTDNFVGWAASLFGKNPGDDPALENALKRMADGPQVTDPQEPRTLDIESYLVVVSRLLGKDVVDDDVLVGTKQLLLRLADEYITAADLLESLRSLDHC